MSSLSLAARRLKPPALWGRQHDSELMAQTALSLILVSIPILWLTLEVGGLGDRVYSSPVYARFPCVAIRSSLFHSQQCLSLEIYYMPVLCIRHREWLGNGEAQVI